MSFGFSVGDVGLLRVLAWTTVQITEKACGKDDERTREVSNLYLVLLRLGWEVENPASLINRGAEDLRDELLSIIIGCEEMLKVFPKIFVKYNAFNMDDRSGQNIWLKLQLGDGQMIDLLELRKNVKYYTFRLSMFLNMLSTGLIGRGSAGDGMDEARRSLILPTPRLALNDVLARYLSEVDSGSLALTDFSKDDTVLWDDLKTELIGKGYPESAISEHMHLIKQFIRQILFEGPVLRMLKDKGGAYPIFRRHDQGNRSDGTIVGHVGVNTSTAYPMQRTTVQLRDESFQQESWLPYSELAVRPYTHRYLSLQQSLAVRFQRITKSIQMCHIFIFLGFLTIVGSLVPAIWRSVARDDISGAFTLAQYILGVGVFVIGCMVAVHSKSCTCWQ